MPLAFDVASAHAGSNPGLSLTRLAPALGPGWPEHLRRVATIATPAPYRDYFERVRACTVAGPSNRLVLLAQAESPTICGMGEQTPGENGLTLHPVYGVPYIPGTSLKGILQAWVRLQGWGLEWDEGGAYFHALFGEGGDKGHAAAVDILDGLMVPTNAAPLQVDVLTPHFASYYQGAQAPKGWEGPNPVPFLVAPLGQTYRLVIEGPEPWLSKAAEWLAFALAERGVGAKTRAGYGRFKTQRVGADDALEQAAAERAAAFRQSKADRIGARLQELGREAVRGELEKWLLGEPTSASMAGLLTVPVDSVPNGTRLAIVRSADGWGFRAAWAKRLTDPARRVRAEALLRAWDTFAGPPHAPGPAPTPVVEATPAPAVAPLRSFTDSELRALFEGARERKGMRWSAVGGRVGRMGDDDSLARARSLAVELGATTKDLESFRRYGAG